MHGVNPRYVVALTGASGAEYALRFLWQLSFVPGETDLIVSPNFLRVLHTESTIPVATAEQLLGSCAQLFGDAGTAHRFSYHDYRDVAARPASGSARYQATVIIPCSMKTLAAINAGMSTNLIERAADVAIKERRKLILCPRETPLSSIHLRNMLALSECGATILPLMPGYYHKPQSLTDLYDFITDRIFQHLGIARRTITPWG
ncbi:MAG: UbiX family flavin prenyltransferase [Turneriella sp.]|nr:UbiX family flavin prenyltransferase [Turneriella sp.]